MSSRAFLSENWQRFRVIPAKELLEWMRKSLAEQIREPMRRSIEAQALAYIGWQGWIGTDEPPQKAGEVKRLECGCGRPALFYAWVRPFGKRYNERVKRCEICVQKDLQRNIVVDAIGVGSPQKKLRIIR